MAERSAMGTYEFNEFAAGPRRYGVNRSRAATSGPVSAAGRDGYTQRDLRAAQRSARLAAVNKQLQSKWANPYAMPKPVPNSQK